jgi:glycosyltransferase involved in cell wall biosynthesis
MTVLAIVVPCFNEQEVLPETTRHMLALLERLTAAGKISAKSRIYFIDDGSRDATWEIIQSFVRQKLPIVGIKLSRNRGHQNALLAGLLMAKGDAVVSIDADLQDDINAIEDMVEGFREGSDIVYGVRRRRNSDSILKRFTAETFYRLIAFLGARTIYNHADFRLLSRRAVDALRDYREVNLYLRGIVPLIGFKSTVVHYDRSARFAGESKYPLKNMIGLALDGVTSFSVVPLRFITLLGFLVFSFTIAMSVYVFYIRLFSDIAVPGWASTTLPIYFLGGVQILCLGVLGEYLGKMYHESKGRPRFIIEDISRGQGD